MALDKQVISVSLGRGIETKSDPRKLVPGQLVAADNIQFSVLGLLKKRNGYLAKRTNIQGSTSSITQGSGIATFKNELDLFEGSELYSFSEATDQWSDKGSATSINLTVNPVIRNSYQQKTPDMAFHSLGLKLFTWEDSRGGSRYSIVDSVSGEFLVSDALVNINAFKPKPFALGAYLVILYEDTNTHNLMYIAMPAVNPTTLVSGGPFTLSSTFNHIESIYDGTVMNNTLFVGYNNTSAGITVVYLSQFLVLNAPIIIPAEPANFCINVSADQALQQIWVTYYNGTSVKTFIIGYSATPVAAVTVNSATPGVATVPVGTGFFANQSFTFGGTGTPATGTSLGTVYFVKTVLSTTTFTFSATSGGAAINTTGVSVAPITFNPSVSILPATVIETLNDVSRVAVIADNGSGTLYYEITVSPAYNNFISTNTLTNTGVVGTPALFLKSVGIVSKPFLYNNIRYLGIAYSSPLQATYFIADQNAKIVAKFSPSLGGGLTSKIILRESVLLAPGVFSNAALIKDLLTTTSGAVYTQTGVTEAIFDFTSLNTYQTSELANNLHISGGILSMYDGTSVVEHGFHLYPEPVTGVLAGGGGLSAGSYLYQVCYEWSDNQGQIHRSAPSVPLTKVAAANDKCTLTIATLRLTAKQLPTRAPVAITIYRSQVNGTTLYQLTNLYLSGSVVNSLLNSTTVDTVTFEDTQADSAIIGNPLLYTTGGVVENIAAPAIDTLTTYQDRVIAIPSENRSSFWYSKQVLQGQPVEFSDLFVQNIDIRGGDITIAQQMDDKLILFKETEIFYLNGDGPTATGANNTFSDAQLITTDGGSVGPFVVVTPLGLMYKSKKGIYLLDRSLQARYIGAPVEAYNGDTVTSAKLKENTNQVIFCLDSGVALAYDYYVNEWSVYTNHNTVDSTIYQGLFTYLKPNGVVMQETPGLYTDAGQFIKMRLVTSWLSLAQLAGYQRAYRLLLLGNYASPHKLLVKIAYDFVNIFTQETLIDAGDLLQNPAYGDSTPYGSELVYGGTAPNYQFEVYFTKQKCTAFQMSIEDIAEAPFGEGFSLSVIGLLIGAKKGLNRLPIGRRFG